MMPVEVDWSRNDTSLLSRFWESRGEKDREEAAEIADRILVYHRGFDKARPFGGWLRRLAAAMGMVQASLGVAWLFTGGFDAATEYLVWV